MPQANGLQFTARVGELPSDMFSVVSFALTEGLSQLFHGRLIMASTDPGIQASDVLEQPVDLMVWQDGTPRRGERIFPGRHRLPSHSLRAEHSAAPVALGSDAQQPYLPDSNH